MKFELKDIRPRFIIHDLFLHSIRRYVPEWRKGDPFGVSVYMNSTSVDHAGTFLYRIAEQVKDEI